MESVNQLKNIVTYEGYKSINLDNFNLDKLRGLIDFLRKDPNYVTKLYISDKEFEDLGRISLDDVKRLTKEILDKYFSITNIDTIDISTLGKSIEVEDTTCDDFYKKINSLLVSKSPYDLDIRLTDGYSMIGEVQKPLVLSDSFGTLDELLNHPSRKMYFSHIELGNLLTKASVSALAHEIAHTQQERNIGYADDYLNREVISVFIEKLVASELDSTGELLKLVEKTRMADLISRFSNLFRGINKVDSSEYINDLMYLKSILIANKLFDMYLSERKQKNRDKYIEDIQKVFDGKIKVEELINSRGITINKCQDMMLLKRRS